MGISAISGAVTGAVGVKFPGMNRLVEGGVDTTVATVERAAYAALDGDMTLEERLAYIFDLNRMAVDFVTGVVIGEAVDGIGNKLPGGWFKRNSINTEAMDFRVVNQKYTETGERLASIKDIREYKKNMHEQGIKVTIGQRGNCFNQM